MSRSFGIEATEDEVLLSAIARTVHKLGFERLWVNDTPMADGLESIRSILEAEPASKVGIGVVPVDRRSPESVAGHLHQMDASRITLGVGAGFSLNPVDAVADWLERFRQLAPPVEVAVAAMGPKMCYLASEFGDVVLLNWMTPERIGWAQQQMATESPARVAAYVRVAIGSDADSRLAKAASLYAALPHYARHFAAMGADPKRVGIAAQAQDVPSLLAPYEELLGETVVRAVAIEGEPKSVLEIAEASAP